MRERLRTTKASSSGGCTDRDCAETSSPGHLEISGGSVETQPHGLSGQSTLLLPMVFRGFRAGKCLRWPVQLYPRPPTFSCLHLIERSGRTATSCGVKPLRTCPVLCEHRLPAAHSWQRPREGAEGGLVSSPHLVPTHFPQECLSSPPHTGWFSCWTSTRCPTAFPHLFCR